MALVNGMADRFDGGDYTKGSSSEPDSVPQPDQILGNASRTLTLMDHRIETVRKQLAELEEQREAFVQDLRKLGGGE